MRFEFSFTNKTARPMNPFEINVQGTTNGRQVEKIFDTGIDPLMSCRAHQPSIYAALPALFVRSVAELPRQRHSDASAITGPGVILNFIDTSNYYARDGVAANELIHEALHPYPDDLVIVTKVGALVEGSDLALPAAEKTGLTPDNLRRGIEANLRSLGLDRLDVVNLRMGDLDRTAAPMAAPLETLLALRTRA